MFICEFHFSLIQLAVVDLKHDIKKIGFKKRQHNLGLGIAEPAVIFDDLGSLGSDHQTEVKAACKGPSFFIHGVYGGQEDALHALFSHFFRIVRVRCHGSHAAGVQSLVSVMSSLVVHGGYHGYYGLSVGEAQN